MCPIYLAGKRKQAADFTCKVTEASTSGKYDTVFYSQAGKRLRSMIAVAKFLIGLKVAALGPFVPGINENEVFPSAHACACIGQGRF